MLKNSKTRGYSLVEMIIYVTILSIVSVVLVNTLLSFTGSYKQLQALRAVDRSAMDVMEKFSRSIRSSTSIDIGGSSFGANPGVLVLVETDGLVSTTTRFYLENQVVKMDVNGVYYGPLSLGVADVTSLVFRKTDSDSTSAIKIEMTVSANIGGVTKQKNFFLTTVTK
ncbi:MAG: type II secretion system protein [Patescibacteria group bacterium]